MVHCYNPLYHTCQYYGIHKKKIEMQLLLYLENSLHSFFILFLFLNKILISNQWKIIKLWGLQQIEDQSFKLSSDLFMSLYQLLCAPR